MHNLLLVITEQFPSYDDIDLKMFPLGEPSNNPRGLELYKDRIGLEQDFIPNIEELLGNAFYLKINCVEGVEIRGESTELYKLYYDQYKATINKDSPMLTIVEHVTPTKCKYEIRIERLYDLSNGVVKALADYGSFELDSDDYPYYHYLDATDQDVKEQMLRYGVSGAVISVDNKPQFYRLTGFRRVWDWWVIGGRWTHYLICDINGRTNATRCSELDLDVMKKGELAYAANTLSQLFRLTMDEFEWATRFNDLDKIVEHFAMAVHEYHTLKQMIIEYNGDVDEFDYKQDMQNFKLVLDRNSEIAKRLQRWLTQVVDEQVITPGTLSMQNFNITKIPLDTCHLSILSHRLDRKVGFQHSFIYSKNEPLDNARMVQFTTTFNNYIKVMARPVFLGTNILIDDILYDPWEIGHVNSDDKDFRFYMPIDNIDEKHQRYFDFESQNSIYYAAFVELPEGRSIPWHMFITGLLSHPDMQSKFVTVVDYHS